MNFWRTTNDIDENGNNGEYEDENDYGQVESQLKASSSFHPVQQASYNLWLNDDKNINFFNKSPVTSKPKFLPKMGVSTRDQRQSQKIIRPKK